MWWLLQDIIRLRFRAAYHYHRVQVWWFGYGYLINRRSKVRIEQRTRVFVAQSRGVSHKQGS